MTDDLRAARLFAAEATKVPGAPRLGEVYLGYSGRHIAPLVRSYGDTSSAGLISLSVRGGIVTKWRLGSRSGSSVVTLKAALIDHFGLGNPAGH